MMNRRLSLLVGHGFLSRCYLPDVESGRVVRTRRPLYSLTRRGAELVEDCSWPAARWRPSAWAVTSHNLVATDMLIAVVEAARRVRIGTRFTPEPELRKLLKARADCGNRFPVGVLPDGAFELQGEGERPRGYCIEVVRAGVKGGNRLLAEKMERYVALNRAGYFRHVYDIEHLRGVLILTTSFDRARRLAGLAARLPHGRNLFWATAYERKAGFAMSFDPATVLSPVFTDHAGGLHSLVGNYSPIDTHV